jgi:ferrochelatase
MPVPPSIEPYDALLVVSFGGPERAEDVVPFLANVTAGRGIPRERLEEVGEHYFARGGRSPINDQNRALTAALRTELDDRGLALPVYWGNRNWDPYLADAFAQMAADGVRRVAAFVTSAYASYSGCRQYREDLFRASAAVPDAPQVDKLRHYFNHPGFVDVMTEATRTALSELPAAARPSARLLFVTHSVPTAMAESAGPDGGAYVAQHLDVASVVAGRVADADGAANRPWELVYCSRSGPPHQPWLEPDVNDRIRAVAGDGEAVVVIPIGFISDHMEVVHDLDTEAAETAAEVGVPFARAATAGTHPTFVRAVVDLLLERAATERDDDPDRQSVGALGPAWDVCAAHCCPNLRGHQPALCETPTREDERHAVRS